MRNSLFMELPHVIFSWILMFREAPLTMGNTHVHNNNSIIPAGTDFRGRIKTHNKVEFR